MTPQGAKSLRIPRELHFADTNTDIDTDTDTIDIIYINTNRNAINITVTKTDTNTYVITSPLACICTTTKFHPFTVCCRWG